MKEQYLHLSFIRSQQEYCSLTNKHQMISKRTTSLFLIVICSIIMVNQSLEAQKDYSDKVEALLTQMTLDEKVGQMNQYSDFWNFTGPAPTGGDAAVRYQHLKEGLVGSMLNVRGAAETYQLQKLVVENSRLGIPLLMAYDIIHGYKTIFPIPLAESASWDMDAIRLSAEMSAMEASAAGLNWTFAPMVDISRDARWGRSMEGAGEDTYLASQIAAARVRGFQGSDLSSPHTLAACAKHYAGYGFVEAGREYNTVDIGTSTLYNVVLPPFKAAVDAGVRTVMSGFHELNGIPVSTDAYLQRDLLKGQWGFDGVIVTDWATVPEIITHGYAADGASATASSVLAGTDIDMQSGYFIAHIKELITDGKVPLEVIDEAVRRILTLKYELGLMDDPYKYCDTTREQAIVGSYQIQEAALDVATKSIVLLKNEDDILPLDQSGLKVAIIGDLAHDQKGPLGNWILGVDDETAVTFVEGMQQYSSNQHSYAQGAAVMLAPPVFWQTSETNDTDTNGFEEAVQLAANSDYVVMVLGEHGYHSGEARSRAHIGLPGVQQALLESVYAVNQNIILILQNGRPLAIPWAAEHIPAIIEGWQLGSQSGHALAKVVYGDANPSGKLPMSFPRAVGQVPIYYNRKQTGRPVGNGNDVFWSHYNDESNDPLYPFGHGLSYTSFTYSDSKVINRWTSEGEIVITANITNTGLRSGREVVQLYIHDQVASANRPIKELKGFAVVELAPEETKEIIFVLSRAELGFYDARGEYKVEPGDFSFGIGGSSAIKLEGHFRIDR